MNALGRSAASKKNGRYLHSKKGNTSTKAEAVVSTRQPRWYSPEDVKKPIPSRKSNKKPTKLRSNITPGTVLIVLAGRFRGKRVVFLKQLESGLLLVTGPYKINGVPLRRINQAYVISTSTKIQVPSVDITDEFFARTKTASNKGSEEFFGDDSQKKAPVSDARKAAQAKVDGAVMKAVNACPTLKAYLNAKFSLTKNDRPHEMSF